MIRKTYLTEKEAEALRYIFDDEARHYAFRVLILDGKKTETVQKSLDQMKSVVPRETLERFLTGSTNADDPTGVLYSIVYQKANFADLDPERANIVIQSRIDYKNFMLEHMNCLYDGDEVVNTIPVLDAVVNDIETSASTRLITHMLITNIYENLGLMPTRLEALSPAKPKDEKVIAERKKKNSAR